MTLGDFYPEEASCEDLGNYSIELYGIITTHMGRSLGISVYHVKRFER